MFTDPIFEYQLFLHIFSSNDFVHMSNQTRNGIYEYERLGFQRAETTRTGTCTSFDRFSRATNSYFTGLN